MHYDILLLEDTDGFSHWLFCMKMVLQVNDLLLVVDSSLAKPDPATDSTGHADWVAKDLRARIQIAGSVQKGPLNLIMQTESAKDCWDKLATCYQGRGGCCIVYLMESFFCTPLINTELMEPQIQKLIKANQNLDTIGCRVKDKTLMYIIIMALLETLSTVMVLHRTIEW